MTVQLVAVDGTNVSALKSLQLSPEQIGFLPSLSSMIDTRFQRKGIARSALSQLLDALELSFDTETLVCYDNHNEAARRLYASFGFVERSVEGGKVTAVKTVRRMDQKSKAALPNLIALSVVEPAGSLIATGQKTLEIRRWKPERLPVLDLAIVQNKRRLSPSDPFDPAGILVAVVDVLAVRAWDQGAAAAACSEWEDGWLAWELGNARQVSVPIAAPAHRRLYRLEIGIDRVSLRRNSISHRRKVLTVRSGSGE